MLLFLEFEFLNYKTLIKSHINKPYTGNMLLKKIIERKGKKINFSVSRITLFSQKIVFACKNCFGKCLFEYKVRFAVEKQTNKNWVNFKITSKIC